MFCFTNKLSHKKVRTMQSKGQGSTCPSKGFKLFSSFSRQKLTVLFLQGVKVSSFSQVSLVGNLIYLLKGFNKSKCTQSTCKVS